MPQELSNQAQLVAAILLLDSELEQRSIVRTDNDWRPRRVAQSHRLVHDGNVSRLTPFFGDQLAFLVDGLLVGKQLLLTVACSEQNVFRCRVIKDVVLLSGRTVRDW